MNPEISEAKTIVIFKPGAIINNRYIIEREIGQGGMGVVYKARDKISEDVVALKFPPRELTKDKRFTKSLKKEAKILLKLANPNIVRLRTLEESNDSIFLVEEFVNGFSLDEYLAEHDSISAKYTRIFIEKILPGLKFIHENNVFHKDIKPANIMFAFDGNLKIEDREKYLKMPISKLPDFSVKLMDFGIAEATFSRLSQLTGKMTSGTLMYMSPEQTLDKNVDARSDIYSFGCVLYEMLTGNPPFTRGDVTHQILHKQPKPIESNDKLLNSLILKSLEKEAGNRWQSTDEILCSLEEKKKTNQFVYKLKELKENVSKLIKTKFENKQQNRNSNNGSKINSNPIQYSGCSCSSCMIKIFVVLIILIISSVVIFNNYKQKNEYEILITKATEYNKEEKWLKAKEFANLAIKTGYKKNSKAQNLIKVANAIGCKQQKEWIKARKYVVDSINSGYKDSFITTTLFAKILKIFQPAKEENYSLPLSANINLDFIWIKLGIYKMGSNEKNERPIHSVSIQKGFWIGKYEVTQLQWYKIMGSNPSEFKKSGLNAPVENVSWDDCKRFCNILSIKTGLKIRLPSETEWEYVCRAGTSTKYYTGNNEDDLSKAGWYGDNSNQTHPVGKKEPNKFGVYDMHGNVYEWCEDKWYDDYEVAPIDENARIYGKSSSRVLRSGGWCHRALWSKDAYVCRSSYRCGKKPDKKDDNIGFRVVLELP